MSRDLDTVQTRNSWLEGVYLVLDGRVVYGIVTHVLPYLPRLYVGLVSSSTEQLWFELCNIARIGKGMLIQLDPKMSTSKCA